jgi:hypothetical protein
LHGGKGHASAGKAGEVQPVHVEELPSPYGGILSGEQRLYEEDEAKHGQSSSDPQEEIVAAAHGSLHQTFVQGRCHRGTAEVEPVAEAPGGIGVASPGAAGDCDWSFRT